MDSISYVIIRENRACVCKFYLKILTKFYILQFSSLWEDRWAKSHLRENSISLSFSSQYGLMQFIRNEVWNSYFVELLVEKKVAKLATVCQLWLYMSNYLRHLIGKLTFNIANAKTHAFYKIEDFPKIWRYLAKNVAFAEFSITS